MAAPTAILYRISHERIAALVLCKKSPKLPFGMYSYTSRLLSRFVQQHSSFTMWRWRIVASVFTCAPKHDH